MRSSAALIAFIVSLVLLPGCRSTPKIDWQSRIGTYTYDQAVVDLGPPDKAAKLSDGRTVADWITRRASRSGFSVGTGIYGPHTGVSLGHGIGTGRGDRVLRLVFGPDNILQEAPPN